VENKKTVEVCRGLDLVNSTIQKIWEKKRTTIIGAFEWTRSRTMRFRKPERNDVNEALLKWFQQHRSHNATVSSPLIMTIFVRTKL
jgi:uncharacterized protein YifE (UPF0438 family)